MGSPEAIAETLKQIPAIIDRGYRIKAIARVMPHAAFLHESTEDWKHRREACGRGMQFNKASQHVQLMLDVIAERSATWAQKDQVELLDEFASLTLDIITRILFGKDIRLDQQLPYVNKQGETEQLALSELYKRCISEANKHGYSL